MATKTHPSPHLTGSEPARRLALAERIFDRFHPVMGWLAALFILVIVGDTVVADESPFATVFTVAGWVIWGVFVADFLLRLAIAPSSVTFLRRNWWQIVFLAMPFLVLFRFLMAIRVARAGRLLSAAVRATRSAASNLRHRLATIGAVTVMVVLLSANVLYEFSGIKPYALALHDAAMATVTGEPITGSAGVTQVTEVLLALYSVIVFATVAGSLGAYFLERKAEGERRQQRNLRRLRRGGPRA